MLDEYPQIFGAHRIDISFLFPLFVTKAVVLTRSQRSVSQNWTVDEHTIEVLDALVHLSSYFTNENYETVEIE